MTHERMKLIAFNTARKLVVTYDLSGSESCNLIGLCSRAIIVNAAKEAQINTIIDSAAYEAITSNSQFKATLETQVKTLLNNRKLY